MSQTLRDHLLTLPKDIILTSVPQAVHVKAVFFDPKTGLLASPPDGRRRLFIELSTIEATSSTEVAAAVNAKYGDFVDAPCSVGYLYCTSLR